MRIYNPKKILVPVDFSDLSMGVLQAGVEIAENRNAKVTVLHIAKESDHIRSYAKEHPGAILSMSGLRADAWRRLDRQLQDMVRNVSPKSKIESILLWGDPGENILHVARSGKFDLIAMGTQGRTGMRRYFLGSVTEEVIRHAPCPVFIIRKKLATKRLEKIEMVLPARN